MRYLHLQETAASEVGAGFWASVSVWSAWFGRQADELTSLLFATPCDASVSASVSVLVRQDEEKDATVTSSLPLPIAGAAGCLASPLEEGKGHSIASSLLSVRCAAA